MPKKGEKMSIEQRAKLSLAHKGKKRKPFSLSWRKKMSEARIGKPHPNKPHKQTEETKAKIRKSKLCVPRTEETKMKLRMVCGEKHWNYGKKRPLETRKKMSESRKGDKSHFWQGGINSINLEIKGSLKYRLWRELIFARDDYTCQECGEKGGRLNAHHIKRFSDYPELRFSLENGVTLCLDCHKKTENYGRKKRN